MGRRSTAIALAAATAGIAYALSRFTGKRRDPHLAQGIVYMGEESYQAAIDHLVQVSSKTPDVLRMLSTCHEHAGNLLDALAYLNVCIRADRLQVRPRVLDRIRSAVHRLAPGHSRDRAETGGPGTNTMQLIERRFHLHRKCGLLKESFRDIFLLNLLDPDEKYSSTTSECLRTCSMASARSYRVSGWASNINFSDFFDTLFFLKDIHDPAVVFIASSEFQKCFEYVKDSGTELHRFLTGCLLLVNGDMHGAARVLVGEAFVYSKMMFLFIKATARADFVWPSAEGPEEGRDDERQPGAPADAAHARATSPKTYGDLFATEDADLKLSSAEKTALVGLAGSEDTTVQFYMAKIFGALKNTRLQLDFINRCLSGRRTPPAMGYKIIMLIKLEKKGEAVSLINRALAAFPDDINLNCIAIEYFLHCNDVPRSLDLFLRIERVHPADPRILIFKYLISKTTGSPDISILRRAIEIDPLYFKTYIHLGNHLMGDEESKGIYRCALRCARSFDELFTAFQLLIVVEAQEALVEEYPWLFEGQGSPAAH